MIIFRNRLLMLISLGFALVASGAFASPNNSGSARQLEGEAAAAFLQESGILSQLESDPPPQGRPFLEPAAHSALDTVAGDQLGVSVAISGDTLIVGARYAQIGENDNQGTAYVFTRSGTTWTQQDKLVAEDGAAGDRFGQSVAVDGETVLVGAPEANVNGLSNQGAAYVFTRSGTTWSEQQKLLAASAAEDQFGFSVALSGETALVGAWLAEVDGKNAQGAAYVFARDGIAWTQQDKLVATDGAADDQFGFSVALDGETALVGAFGDNSQQGAAYVFTRSGTTWSEQQKLAADDGDALDQFGRSVALDGETALVGAWLADINDEDDQGAAYLFTRSGTTWSQQQKLVAEDGKANDQFGLGVAVDGETTLVGTHLADVSEEVDQGAAYLFTYSDGEWNEQQKLVAADGEDGDRFGVSVALDGDKVLVGAYLADSGAGKFYTTSRGLVPWPMSGDHVADDGESSARFGASVALDGDTVLVGASGDNSQQGAAYVFTHSAGEWSQQQKLVANDGAADDQFGSSVALDGETVLVGAWGANTYQGAVYVFTRSSGEWSQQQKLVANDGAAEDMFGVSMALDGETALVGAFNANLSDNTGQGTAYLFTRSGIMWSQQQKLVAEDGAAKDQFGSSVALDGETALVGAYNADINDKDDQGAAYLFTRSGTTWSQQDKLVADDGKIYDNFGFSVALSGETALVGAWGVEFGQGAAYVFTRNGTMWSQQQKLVVEDGMSIEHFGSSIALDGETVLIGAFNANLSDNTGQGTAYLFTRSGTMWSQQQKLVAEDGETYDYFGGSVALDGETALVAAASADVSGAVDQGKIYFFERQPLERDRAANDYFGGSVAVDGETALVGATDADFGGRSNHGAVYVFTRSGGEWSQQQKLVASDGADRDFFGVSVALDGETALIGADQAIVNGKLFQGAVYVFTRSGGEWNQQQKLVADDGASGDSFGHSVALDGETALVGAIGTNFDQGAAYVFTRSDGEWSQQQKLEVTDDDDHSLFGISVALDGETALVGADLADIGNNSNQGAAYVFTRSGTIWSRQQKLVANDGAAEDRFGRTVALDGETALVGAFAYNDESGAAYVFTRSGTTWSQQQKLTADNGADGDRFGLSVALDGETALIGAWLADTNDTPNQGAAYLFTRSGSTWFQQQKLIASDGVANEEFGISLALSGETVLVGAPLIDDGNGEKGRVYVFNEQQLSQTIAFPTVPDSLVGDTIPLEAVASSGLPVAYQSETTSVCTIADQSVTLIAAGTCQLTASQAGNYTYAEAEDVSITFLVSEPSDSKLSQTITFPAVPDGLVGDTILLEAVASSNLPVAYQSETTSVCTITGESATLISIGECQITASQAGNDTYAEAEDVSITFFVSELEDPTNEAHLIFLPILMR